MLDIVKKVLDKIITKRNVKRFTKTAALVRRTHPAHYITDESVVIVSQVYHNAMDMTLLALKSFLEGFGRGTVEVIDDGSLTNEDKELLRKQIPGIKIIPIDSIDTGKCPKGSCWERLIYILNRSKDAYVIQVDTDTITLGALPEIDHFVRNNQGFTIGGPMWPKPVSPDYMKIVTDQWNSPHIQATCENKLSELIQAKPEGYLRGCAAFAGFAKGVVTLEQLEILSQEMSGLVGEDRWNKWGSEQFASNVMMSMCAKAEILPWPKYQNFMQPEYRGNYQGVVSLIHFIGSYRFDNRVYESIANNMIYKYK